jgi:hypothetical protein
MTIQQLLGLVGKTGRIIPTTGKPPWEGLYTCVGIDTGRLTKDDIEGDKSTGPRLIVESVARRVEHPASGAPPVETSDPADKCSDLPPDWFVPSSD